MNSNANLCSFQGKKKNLARAEKRFVPENKKKASLQMFFLSVFMKSAFRSRSEERVKKKKHYKILFLPSINFFFGGKNFCCLIGNLFET